MHLRMMRGQSCTVTFGKTCNTMPFAKPQKRHIDHLKFVKKTKRKWNDDGSHSYIDITGGVYIKCVCFKV